MSYKIFIYVISLFTCAYAVTGINFEKFIRKNKIVETRFLGMVLSIGLAYLVANFIIDFINFSKFI